ncbi:6-phosphogluconolactonase [archaeon]|jgi:6-phosphogluconolactonase|nr:6-phosphogluconolactonase [archaeon]MBT4352045.1 6-phosphogluconolactonase [archaeon]MBT4647760.1 6-phosphogluconolactonase [archaeon]MBT6821621.1 6-phosphogluconolactonase [archaeon]MBT7391851.1 6-phosphogluconolactonase [archaeon]
MDNVKLVEVHDYTHLKVDSVSYFCHEIKKVLRQEEIVTVAIPGGRSIKALFDGFKETHSLTIDEWNKIHFFWADERLVGPEDKQSNYRLAKESFLDDMIKKGFLKKENIHRYIGESDDPIHEIKEYNKELLKLKENIDILVLGVGEDGHIASLFPNHPNLKEKKSGFMLVTNSPKPPGRRMSLTPKMVLNANSIMLFFIGEGKKIAYNNFLDDKVKLEDCPAKLSIINEEAKIYAISGTI